MAINVNTNVSAMTAQRHLSNAAADVNKSMERLSSGYRINSARDDAAGLQITNRLNSQSSGLETAVRNANDGISIAQTAEGGMKETTNILQRMRDLSLQSANGSNSTHERRALNEEVQALNDELNRIAESTSFGGKRLLNGNYGTQSFQIGANSGEAVQLTIRSMRSDEADMGGNAYVAQNSLNKDWRVGAGADITFDFTDEEGAAKTVTINAIEGDDIESLATYINGQTEDISASVGEDGTMQLFASNRDVTSAVTVSGSLASDFNFGAQQAVTVNDVDVTSIAGSQQAVAVIDAALQSVDSQRAELGAFQNRFDHAINNLDNINENVNASRSRIQDTDFAKETTQLAKSQILQNASTSILAQAKQTPTAAIALLG